MYPLITYSSEDEYRFSRRVAEPHSFILSAALEVSGFYKGGIVRGKTLAELPYYEEFEVERIPRYKKVAYVTSHGDEEIEEVEDEDYGYICQFAISEVRKHSEDFEELLDELNDDKFVLKKQYHAAQRFLKAIAEKQKTENDSLLDLL